MGNDKKGRPKEANSLRSLDEKRKIAEQKAAKAEQKAREMEEALQERLLKIEEAEQRAKELESKLEADRLKAEQEAAELDKKRTSEWAKIKDKLDQELEEEEEEEEKLETTQVETDDELLNMLNGVLTKEKHPQQQPQTKEVEVDDDGDFDDDFDADFEPAKEPTKIKVEPTDEGKVRVGIPPKDMAKTAIWGLDHLMKWLGPLSYKKASFSKEEWHRIRQIGQLAKTKNKEISLDDQDLELLSRLEDFAEYKESVPLNEEEKEMLRVPLFFMLKDKGGDVPPGVALMGVAAMIMLPRFSPQMGTLFNNAIEKLFKVTTNEQSEVSDLPTE